MASETKGGEPAAAFLGKQGGMIAAGASFSGYERDLFAMNRGDGTFLDVSGVSGLDSITDGRGAVFADFDNDGDLDIFLRAMHDQAHLLFRNDLGTGRFVRVALEGRASGREAWGAIVRVGTSAGTLTQVKACGSGFLSQSDPRLLFGLGGDEAAKWIEVAWPSGKKQRFAGPRAGASVKVVEGEPALVELTEKRFALPDPDPASDRAFRALAFKKGERLPRLDLLAVGGGAAPGAWEPVGAPFIIDVWATWCAACGASMPELQRLHETTGVKVVGISVDGEESRGGIPKALRAAGVKYPVYVATPAALKRLFGGSDVPLPLALVVDAKGNVVDAVSGWSSASRSRLAAAAGGTRGRKSAPRAGARPGAGP